jgi:hypothetical protein
MAGNIEPRGGPTLAELVTAPTPKARLAAARRAMGLVEVDWAPLPVPACFAELPVADDDDEGIGWEIAARVLGSANPYSADAAGRLQLSALIGRKLTVHELRVHPLTPADVEEDPDRRIGAYLDLAVSVDDDEDQVIASSGSPRVIAPLVHAYATGGLPITGTVIAVAPARGKRSAPLAFVVEEPL